MTFIFYNLFTIFYPNLVQIIQIFLYTNLTCINLSIFSNKHEYKSCTKYSYINLYQNLIQFLCTNLYTNFSYTNFFINLVEICIRYFVHFLYTYLYTNIPQLYHTNNLIQICICYRICGSRKLNNLYFLTGLSSKFGGAQGVRFPRYNPRRLVITITNVLRICNVLRCYDVNNSVSRTRFVRSFIELATFSVANGHSVKLECQEINELVDFV